MVLLALVPTVRFGGTDGAGRPAAGFTLPPEECGGLDPWRGQAEGIRGNSWPEPMPCGRELTFPSPGEGAAPHSPVTFQVGHFPEPRCLLMSWGERLSALYPSSGPHITSGPRGWPVASRLWLQARALCQPGLSGQLAYRCQPGASLSVESQCDRFWGPSNLALVGQHPCTERGSKGVVDRGTQALELTGLGSSLDLVSHWPQNHGQGTILLEALTFLTCKTGIMMRLAKV